jgi:glycosyltransferase 2 family protein
MKNKIIQSLKVIVMLIIFTVMIYYLANNWSSLKEYDLTFNPIFLIISFILLGLSHILASIGWNLILKLLKSNIPQKSASGIYFISQLGRYIPGKVWYILGRVGMTRKHNVPKRIIILSGFLELILVMASASIIFLLALIFFPIIPEIQNYLPHLTTLVILILIGIHPKSLNILLKILKKTEMKIKLSYTKILLTLLFFIVVWIIKGIAFYYLISSITILDISSLFWIISVFSISWVIGYLILITPGGIGAREGLIIYLLSPLFPIPLTIAISLLTRIWMIITEFTLSIAGLKLK